MQITARNFRGLERANLTLAPLALVCARNGQGKTSLLQAVQSALLATPIPPKLREQGATQKGAKDLVHRTADEGSVQVVVGGGSVVVSWPKCKVDIEGDAPPRASEFAAGAVSLVDLGERERVAALSRYLDAQPSAQDLARAMADAGYDEAAATKCWTRIEDSGWDFVWEHARKHGTTLEGRWRQATGEKYGSKKAGTWKPADWSLEDAAAGGPSEAYLAEALQQAEATLERTIARHAVAEANVEQLREQAAAIPDLEAQEKKADAEAEQMQLVYHEWTIKQPPKIPSKPMPCPSCNEPLAVSQDGKSLEPRPDAPGEQEIEDAKLALAAFNKDKEAARAAFDEAYAKRQKIRDRLIECRQAANRIAKLGGGDGEAASEEEVAAARAARDKARALLEQQKTFDLAHALHHQIQKNARLVAILAPEGLRRRKMVDALKGFNARLAEASNAAGWPVVALDEALQVRYGSEAYWQASDSHQWRARTVLQVVMASLEGASAALIDGADVLDAPGRNGLIKMLKAAGVPALICMTINRPDLVPDLSAAGLGQSYWIEGGTAEPIAQQKEKAA